MYTHLDSQLHCLLMILEVEKYSIEERILLPWMSIVTLALFREFFSF